MLTIPQYYGSARSPVTQSADLLHYERRANCRVREDQVPTVLGAPVSQTSETHQGAQLVDDSMPAGRSVEARVSAHQAAQRPGSLVVSDY